tara:strand:+ start:588 stop:797 length:210 start_codon:yes stop_codon:yes gene_type:complete
MTKYEVTGYIQIPVFHTLEAATPAEALRKGSEEIENGFGVQGDQYWQDDYTLWDMDADMPVPVEWKETK